jgi:hypothetical protein
VVVAGAGGVAELFCAELWAATLAAKTMAIEQAKPIEVTLQGAAERIRNPPSARLDAISRVRGDRVARFWR